MSQPPRRRRPARRKPRWPWVLLCVAVLLLGVAAYTAFGRSDAQDPTPVANTPSEPNTAMSSTASVEAADTTATSVTAAVTGATTTTGAEAAFEIVAPIPNDVRATMEGKSMKEGCPVGYKGLALLHLTYLGFNGKPQIGDLIVAKQHAKEVLEIFKSLYGMKYPIQKMELIDKYRNDKGEWADDTASIDANNTSAFNCRPVTGGTGFSKHAYGIAIDINPIQNPYVLDGASSHAASTPFLDRVSAPTPPARRAVLVADDAVVRLFAKNGWEWGGAWSNPIDYQHFSKGGG